MSDKEGNVLPRSQMEFLRIREFTRSRSSGGGFLSARARPVAARLRAYEIRRPVDYITAGGTHVGTITEEPKC